MYPRLVFLVFFASLKTAHCLWVYRFAPVGHASVNSTQTFIGARSLHFPLKRCIRTPPVAVGIFCLGHLCLKKPKAPLSLSIQKQRVQKRGRSVSVYFIYGGVHTCVAWGNRWLLVLLVYPLGFIHSHFSQCIVSVSLEPLTLWDRHFQ